MPLSCPTAGSTSAEVYRVPYTNSYGLNSAIPRPSAVRLICEMRLIFSLPFLVQQRTLCFPSPTALSTFFTIYGTSEVSPSSSTAPLESTPASFVTFHISSLYVALCGRSSASISTCILSGESTRLPFTFMRMLRTGISISSSASSIALMFSPALTPVIFPQANASMDTATVSIPSALTSSLISPGSVLAAITARSFPENILLLSVLYWSKSVLSPLSIPTSLPAPLTFTYTRLLAFSTGFPSLSTALMSTYTSSLPSALILVHSGVTISFTASEKLFFTSLAITLPLSS